MVAETNAIIHQVSVPAESGILARGEMVSSAEGSFLEDIVLGTGMPLALSQVYNIAQKSEESGSIAVTEAGLPHCIHSF